MHNTAIDESYFLANAQKFAEFQGFYVQDKEFVEKFQNHFNNLPRNLQLRKKWLETFIDKSRDAYINHTKDRKNHCQPQCQSTLCYVRGIPHAQAELQKIDPVFLYAEWSATFIKNFPSWLMKKSVAIGKLVLGH